MKFVEIKVAMYGMPSEENITISCFRGWQSHTDWQYVPPSRFNAINGYCFLRFARNRGLFQLQRLLEHPMPHGYNISRNKSEISGFITRQSEKKKMKIVFQEIAICNQPNAMEIIIFKIHVLSDKIKLQSTRMHRSACF